MIAVVEKHLEVYFFHATTLNHSGKKSCSDFIYPSNFLFIRRVFPLSATLRP